MSQVFAKIVKDKLISKIDSTKFLVSKNFSEAVVNKSDK